MGPHRTTRHVDAPDKSISSKITLQRILRNLGVPPAHSPCYNITTYVVLYRLRRRERTFYYGVILRLVVETYKDWR